MCPFRAWPRTSHHSACLLMNEKMLHFIDNAAGSIFIRTIRHLSIEYWNEYVSIKSVSLTIVLVKPYWRTVTTVVWCWLRCRGGPEVNTSPLVHEVSSWNPDKYQCVFFNANVLLLSKFILDITDIGEGIHREETWTYNQNESEIANPSWASVVINAHAFSIWEEAFAQQWDSNRLEWWLIK